MEVYIVSHYESYEGSYLLGVFDSIELAQAFATKYAIDHELSPDYEWCDVRKVEINRVYDSIFDVGEVQ